MGSLEEAVGQPTVSFERSVKAERWPLPSKIKSSGRMVKVFVRQFECRVVDDSTRMCRAEMPRPHVGKGMRT